MKKHLLLIALQLAASSADAYYTHRCVNVGRCGERDPIARPFVYHTSTQILYFSATAGLQIEAAHLLRTHGHERLADAAALGGIVDNAIGAMYTKVNTKQGK